MVSGFYSKIRHIYAIIVKMSGCLSKWDIYPNRYMREKKLDNILCEKNLLEIRQT